MSHVNESCHTSTSHVTCERVMSHRPRPAGETVEVSSWEELCMCLFAYSSSSSSLESSGSPMVYCGKPDARQPLLTTAQVCVCDMTHS